MPDHSSNGASCIRLITPADVIVAVQRLPDKISVAEALQVNLLKQVAAELAPYKRTVQPLTCNRTFPGGV